MTRDQLRVYWWITEPFLVAIAIVMAAVWILASMACGTVQASLPSVPIPQRPADRPWRVGVTFAPFTEDEWAHVAPMNFVWRVQRDQAADVDARGQAMLLLAVCESDASVTAFADLLPHANVYGIELGNEPNFGQDAASVNAWYLREIAALRASGYTGLIATAGIGNIDDGTLTWLQRSIQGLPTDVGVSFHAYSNWRPQLGKLIAITGSHPLLMTEWGEPPPNGDEQAQASTAASDLAQIKAAGAVLAARYQMHDEKPGASGYGYGLFAYDKHARPTLDVLAAANQ